MRLKAVANGNIFGDTHEEIGVELDRNGVLRARIKPYHAQRLEKLSQATGLNASQIIRSLIENAVLVPSPMPAATISRTENCRDAETTLSASGVPA